MHPMNKFRQSNVERARVGNLVKGYAGGGGVHKDAEQDKKLIKNMIGKELGEIGGVKAAFRADRPNRARGGKVGKKATTVVNVITGGQQPPPAAPPMPMPAAPPPGPPPGAPPGAALPPPGGPPPMAGGPPPGMPMRAKGGGVKSVGMKVGTKVSHDKGKNDLGDINRPRVVTFATGGGVRSFTAYRGRNSAGGAGGGKGRLAKAKAY